MIRRVSAVSRVALLARLHGVELLGIAARERMQIIAAAKCRSDGRGRRQDTTKT